jgi:hypothetical protein
MSGNAHINLKFEDASASTSPRATRYAFPWPSSKIDLAAFELPSRQSSPSKHAKSQSLHPLSLKGLQRNAFRSSQGFLERVKTPGLGTSRPQNWAALVLELVRVSLRWLWVDEGSIKATRELSTGSGHTRTPSIYSHGRLWRIVRTVDGSRRRIGISRLGCVMLLGLLWLGYFEVYRKSFTPEASAEMSIAHLVGRHDPVSVLKRVGYWKASSPSALPPLEASEADVTAILLNWKRLPNLLVLVAHLCQFPFIKTVIIHNNHPSTFLTPQHFHSTQCAASKLQIHNPPSNGFFLPRHLHCANAETAHCLHLDDDYLFYSLEAVYSIYKSDQGRELTVFSDPEMASLFNLEWCFLSEFVELLFCPSNGRDR